MLCGKFVNHPVAARGALTWPRRWEVGIVPQKKSQMSRSEIRERRKGARVAVTAWEKAGRPKAFVFNGVRYVALPFDELEGQKFKATVLK